MNAYTVKPGNIASVCAVFDPEEKETVFIYLADGKLPATVCRREEDQFEAFKALPLEVRAAVNKHFGTVFALPVDRRGEFLKSCIPFIVNASA